MTLEGKEVKMEIKGLQARDIKVVDAEQGIIEAYVSIFGNVDSYGDVVEKGAFTESINKWFPRFPKGVWAHDWSMPIAKTLEIREDERGLYIKGQLILSVQKGQEAYELIKQGVITDFSFGYEVDEAEIDENTGMRHLKKLTIYEWSPVLVGANNRATLIGVKSDGQVIEEPAEEEVLEESEDEDKNKGVEEKSGRVLSEKNRELIKTAMDEITVARESMNNIFKMFEALLQATEQPSTTDEGKTAVDQRGRSGIVKNLLLRDARQALKAQSRLLVRVKRIINL